jgi:hypothetical protein
MIDKAVEAWYNLQGLFRDEVGQDLTLDSILEARWHIT